MELYLIRHGESESNAKWTDHKDSPLTPLGFEQARRAAEALRDAGIERLYCSPQQRGLQTATVIGELIGLGPIAWPELSERGFGGPEPGLPRSEIVRRFPHVTLPDTVDEAGWARHWNGETEEDLGARMANVAETILQWARSGSVKRVACVIHGASGARMVRTLVGAPVDFPLRVGHHNCGITRMAFEEDGLVRVRYANDQRHLVGLPGDSRRDAAATG